MRRSTLELKIKGYASGGTYKLAVDTTLSNGTAVVLDTPYPYSTNSWTHIMIKTMQVSNEAKASILVCVCRVCFDTLEIN